jgi:hypothetical protein
MALSRREARTKLGTRTHRRSNTKTRVIPGANMAKKPPKYTTHRASRGKKSNAAKVAELLRQN